MFTSLAYLKTLEKNNDPWAIHWLAACYYHGDGVPQDLEKALEYYRRAHDLILESGDDRFRKDLPALKYAIGACLYERADSGTSEPSGALLKGLKWVREAAAMGDPEAREFLRKHASYFTPGKILWRLLFVESKHQFKSPLERLKSNFRVYRDILAHRKDNAALFAA